MASAKNDSLCQRTVEGSVNYYDNQTCKGTANEKAIAARLGSMTYNIMSNGKWPTADFYLKVRLYCLCVCVCGFSYATTTTTTAY